MVEEYSFCLYVAGRQAPNSIRAMKNLEKLLRNHITLPYSLEVVDILENPDRAESDRISATPTLAWQIGKQRGRLVGDFSNSEKVISFLR